mgnify:CR=1 FL=1
MKILVIQQKMIGDVLVSSLLCDNLRKAYPEAQIDYMVYESTTAVLQGNTSFNKLVLFREKHRNSKWEFFKLIRSIRKEKYDIIIDAYSKMESWLIVLFSGAPKKISYWKKNTNFIYTHPVKKEKAPDISGSIIDVRLSLLTPLKLVFPLKNTPEIHVSREEKEFASSLFAKHNVDPENQTIMLNVLGSSESKTYPFIHMAEVIDFIAEKGDVNLLFNYHPKQISEASKILNYCKESTRKKVYFTVFGKSIREFIAIMDNCDMIIGNDGGAINMAKALKKPSFIIFSPWIDKAGWATFEDGINNVSVHLRDHKPELFEEQDAAAVKKNALKMYQQFPPNLFFPALGGFLDRHLD